MKTNTLFFPIVLGIATLTLVTFSAFESHKTKITHNEGGTASSCGSPGELGTCSRPTCHGAGATPAGVPDNAGPGSLTLTSVPAFTGNQYVPGQVYNMTVTVGQAGIKKRFGFGCEILDNSGNTNGHINNTAGIVTVTDHINTRIWQAYGTGRLSITHDTNGGFGSNPYSFHFNWTAPSGAYPYDSVNIYLCGNASDNNLLADSGDYIYSQHIILTKNLTGIQSIDANTIGVNAYPIPTNNQLTVSVNMPEEGNMIAILYSLDGKVARELENSNVVAGTFTKTYAVNDVAKGIYLLKVRTEKTTTVKKIIIY